MRLISRYLAPLLTYAAISIGATAAASGLVIGTGGHDAWTTPTWENYNAAAAFQIMNQRNMRTYRVDVSNNALGYAALTKLVALGKQYNITIRPMLDVDSGNPNDAYTIAKMFASSIHVWELGNELNLRGTANFTASINLMIQARNGIMQAAAATGQPMKTVINVAAMYGGNIGLNSTGTSYPFIDQAISMGLNFDYISFHYYPASYDLAQGWMKLYLNALRKYAKPVLLNESNCVQIYYGDNGNSAACNLTMSGLLAIVQNNYSDMINEMNFYEIIDDPGAAGAEGHFGIMFNLASPKLTIGTATLFTANSAALTVPIVVNTSVLTPVQFVTELYAAVLDRVPDPAGLAFWSHWLGAGARPSRVVLLTASLASGEFERDAALMDDQAFVARLYLAVFGRPVDVGSLALYGGALDTKLITRSQLTAILLGSSAFAARPL